MKATETYQNQDGSTYTRQINIPLEQGRGQVCHTLVPTTDEPIAVKIVEAGWYDGGPTFHIITEYGDFHQSDYDYGNLAYVLQKYPEFKETWEELYPAVLVSTAELRKFSNDQELGNWTRKQSCNTNQNRKEVEQINNQLEFNF